MTIPIPQRPSGFLLGDPAATTTIDAFVDIQCPHSKTLWPTLMAVMDHYQQQPLSLKTHLITLSNHRQAWDVSLGLFAYAKDDAKKFYDFASLVFTRQEEFYNAPFTHKTHEDLRQYVADLAEQHAEIDRDDFLNAMQEHEIYIQARTPIRYAATRSVWATPTLFINNAGDVPVNHKSSVDDWIQALDPLLKNNPSR